MDGVRRNKMMVVDPESNCRLFDTDNGDVKWLIEENKPLLYQYHHPIIAKDYLNVVVGEDGTMDLYRHTPHEKKMVWCRKEDDVEAYLRNQYEAQLLEVSMSKFEVYSNSISLDVETGEIGESANSCTVLRKDYHIQIFYRMGFKTITRWELRFSRFRAFYPKSNRQTKPYSIPVFHATDIWEFYKFCRNFGLMEGIYPNSIMKSIVWKIPPLDKRHIELSKRRVGESNMFSGKLHGIKVAVDRLPRRGDLEKHARNLKRLGTHENILGFHEAETDGIEDFLAYEITFIIPMNEYIATKCDTTGERTSKEWLLPLRGSLNALQFLHTHGLIHEELKVNNVFVKDNFTFKLAGLSSVKQPEGDLDIHIRNNIFDWGKILLNIMTEGAAGNEDGVPDNLRDILNRFSPQDREVADLLELVLDVEPMSRPLIDVIREHPALCDWESRVKLLVEMSDFCKIEKREANQTGMDVHPMVTYLDVDAAEDVFDGTWNGLFDKSALKIAVEGRGIPYDYEMLTELLLLFRNIVIHLPEIRRRTTYFGTNQMEVEYRFRRIFPRFFSVMHTAAKTHLDTSYKHHCVIVDNDIKKEPSETFEMQIPDDDSSLGRTIY